MVEAASKQLDGQGLDTAEIALVPVATLQETIDWRIAARDRECAADSAS